MFKYVSLLLLLTIPLLGGRPLWGVPLWVWGSLAATLAYAIALLIIIQKDWDTFKRHDDA